MDFFIQNAYAQSAQQGDSTSFIIMMVLMFGAFYFLLIRPQQKKQKAHVELVAGLSVGDEVLTARIVLNDKQRKRPVDWTCIDLAQRVCAIIGRRLPGQHLLTAPVSPRIKSDQWRVVFREVQRFVVCEVRKPVGLLRNFIERADQEVHSQQVRRERFVLEIDDGGLRRR